MENICNEMDGTLFQEFLFCFVWNTVAKKLKKCYIYTKYSKELRKEYHLKKSAVPSSIFELLC